MGLKLDNWSIITKNVFSQCIDFGFLQKRPFQVFFRIIKAIRTRSKLLYPWWRSTDLHNLFQFKQTISYQKYCYIFHFKLLLKIRLNLFILKLNWKKCKLKPQNLVFKQFKSFIWQWNHFLILNIRGPMLNLKVLFIWIVTRVNLMLSC